MNKPRLFESETILEARALSKDFDGCPAVKAISFSISKGEIFGFLGPNGAGKTTTINMLTGLAKPTSGSFTIAGVDGVTNIKGVQRLIGIVPDASNLYDDLSGKENLVFCASLYGVPKEMREEKAARLLRQFGLTDIGARPFRAYSKGMKRKLTIAAGIIHQPGILFLDEPTTGIDVESARQVRRLIQDMNQQGTTIFLTTHYIEEAERLCHRIGFIVQGSLVKLAKTTDLIQAAQIEHTVEFTMEAIPEQLGEQLQKEFPNHSVQAVDQRRLRITAGQKINLMPFMIFFAEQGCIVQEARLVHPSLEEIFVKITGIEARTMTGESHIGGGTQ